jgi:hypothetical protein
VYVSHASGPPGLVSSYSPKGDFLEQIQAGSEKITALKLNDAGDKLLTTSGGPQLHQYSIGGSEPDATVMVAAAGAKGGHKGATWQALEGRRVGIPASTCTHLSTSRAAPQPQRQPHG